MPTPLTIDYDAARLRTAARASKDANQTRRLLALAAIYDGATRTDTAVIGGVTVQTVRDWVVKRNADGPEGLIDRRGTPPILNDEYRRALALAIEDGPIPAIRGVVRWRVIAERLEQHAADELAAPPLDRLPRTKIRRQRSPATAAAGHVADSVQHFPQVHADLPATFGRFGHQRLDPDPLLVGQVSRIPLGLARNLDHPATALSGPHPKLESQPAKPPQTLSNSLLSPAVSIPAESQTPQRLAT